MEKKGMVCHAAFKSLMVKLLILGRKILVTGEQIAAQRNFSPANVNGGSWQSISVIM
jgi:hypothetical protein